MSDWQSGWAQQRIITIFADITNDCARDTISQMWGFAALSNDPITLLLNTPGGEIPHALAIIQAMKACPAPVDTLAIGRVYSAGVLILIAGRQRKSFPHTLFMTHDFHNTRQIGASYETLKGIRIADDWTYQRLLGHFRDHTKISVQEIKKKLLATEYYFDENESLGMGMIDDIILEKITLTGASL